MANTEDRTYKQVIAIILVAAILAVGVYGSYIPMRKAEMFIGTLQGFQTQPPSSLADLEQRVSVPLDYPSPVGQEEVVRNFANSILGFVQQSGNASTTEQLVGFLGSYYDPIIARGRGMSFGQDLYLMGAINEVAFATTGGQNFLADSIRYYKEARDQGPNRPQALYGLFDVYRASADVTDTIATGQAILKNWPNDMRIQQALAQFLSGASRFGQGAGVGTGAKK